MTSFQWAELKVRDLPRQERFYRDLFGWEPLARQPGRVDLGPLRLQEDARAQIPVQVQPGLFHLAFLTTDASSLGGWLQQATAQGVHLEGASDHGVSQALYLSDPEGNGIEVYADRAREEWPGAPGRLEMFTRRLDLDSLLRGARPWNGPVGLRLGHIHLRSLDSGDGSEWFARLGMPVTVHYPGAEFYAADGYHHHFAVNNWGVGPAHTGNWTGLTGYALCGQYANEEVMDPWGRRVELRSA